LSIGCPNLATVVQIWPALSILGQFWPSLANLVHVALSYIHRVVLRGRRRALKSENSLRKAREQPSRGLKHCRAGRVAVRERCPGRRVGRGTRPTRHNFRAAASADADLRKSAPRVMYGPRLATPGAGQIFKEQIHAPSIQVWPESFQRA